MEPFKNNKNKLIPGEVSSYKRREFMEKGSF